jgi:hypothetical protein
MSIEEKEGRHGRSVRLTTSINTRLIALCDHLGVTPNAYLVQAIGKAITTDELHFKLGQTSDASMQFFNDIQQQANEMIAQSNQIHEKQLPLDKDL